jgi:putative membrane protein
MKNFKAFLIVSLSAVMLVSCNNNRKTSNTTEKDPDKNAMLVENAKVGAKNDDQGFVQEAANGGLMEVELGRYAEQNASNPRVKNFGAMMVRDHSKANDELKSIAAGKNITLPATMDDNHMNMVNELKKKSGADFDRDYIKEMVDDHEKDVDKFRKQAEDGTDPELKSFASKTLPVLIAHQDSAKSIRDALNNKNTK